jgi:NAD(P)H-quinone oxidoreductase subunit 5
MITETSWLIPLYPLAGALLTIPWSPGLIRRTGPRPAGYINIAATFMAFIHSVLAFNALWTQHSSPQFFFVPWLQVADFSLTIPLQVSVITLGAAILITGLNLLAQVYAVAYLEMDWGWGRFYAFMALFEAGMCALVLCNSLFFSYMLLEVLTLGTYLLVGFLVQPVLGGNGGAGCISDQAGWRSGAVDGGAGHLPPRPYLGFSGVSRLG